MGTREGTEAGDEPCTDDAEGRRAAWAGSSNSRNAFREELRRMSVVILVDLYKREGCG